MSAFLSILVTALMRVLVSIATAPVAEKFMRKVLIHSLEWIVNSTANPVDNDMIAPILQALSEQDKG